MSDGDIKLINDTRLDLNYQASVIPIEGHDYPLRNPVSGLWETRALAFPGFSGAPVLPIDTRHMLVENGSGALEMQGDTVHPLFPDQNRFVYLVDGAIVPGGTPGQTYICTSHKGYGPDNESGHTIKYDNPNFLLLGGFNAITWRDGDPAASIRGSIDVQPLSGWQHPQPFGFMAQTGVVNAPISTSNWREPHKRLRTGAFLWSRAGGLVTMELECSAPTVGTKVFGALVGNPIYLPGSEPAGYNLLPSSGQDDGNKALVSNEVFSVEDSVIIGGHSEGLLVMTATLNATAAASLYYGKVAMQAYY